MIYANSCYAHSITALYSCYLILYCIKSMCLNMAIEAGILTDSISSIVNAKCIHTFLPSSRASCVSNLLSPFPRKDGAVAKIVMSHISLTLKHLNRLLLSEMSAQRFNSRCVLGSHTLHSATESHCQYLSYTVSI